MALLEGVPFPLGAGATFEFPVVGAPFPFELVDGGLRPAVAELLPTRCLKHPFNRRRIALCCTLPFLSLPRRREPNRSRKKKSRFPATS